MIYLTDFRQLSDVGMGERNGLWLNRIKVSLFLSPIYSPKYMAGEVRNCRKYARAMKKIITYSLPVF